MFVRRVVDIQLERGLLPADVGLISGTCREQGVATNEGLIGIVDRTRAHVIGTPIQGETLHLRDLII